MFRDNEQLIEHLKEDGPLETPRIINAFRAVDRADFVKKESKRNAYIDRPLPIGEGQTISQPYTVAFMLEKLQPEFGDKILDIGSGSGWTTALLAYCAGISINKADEVDGEKTEVGKNDNADNHQFSQMDIGGNLRTSESSGSVIAVELEEKLCQFGASNTAKYFKVNNLCTDNTSVSSPRSSTAPMVRGNRRVTELSRQDSVFFLCKDGSVGVGGCAPFDKILVSASTPEVPSAWKEQLKIGGRLVFPSKGSLWKYEKIEEGEFKKEEYPGFRFVRLRGNNTDNRR